MAKVKRDTPEIGAGSMADISFLLLSFFLMTSNMDQTSGLQRRLPPMPPENQKSTDAPKVKERNVYQVKINQWDALLAGGRPMDLMMLKDEVKNFILNPANDPNMSEKEDKDFGGRTYSVSSGVISLQNDRGTSYDMYIRVQNELVAAFNELRDEFSRQEFGGRPYEELTEDEQNVVRDVIPQNISEANPKDVGAANTRRR